MPHYIWITFLFLGLALYELSGGADFESGTVDQIATSGQKNVPEAGAAIHSDPTPVLAKLAPEPPALAQTSETAMNDVAQPVSLNLVAETQEPIRVASLADPVSFANTRVLPQEPEAEPAAQPAPAPDLREVIATRVNVRSGPGTETDIVMRANRGQTVAVLDNNGLGWLQVTVMPDDRQGWIAERLVSSKD